MRKYLLFLTLFYLCEAKAQSSHSGRLLHYALDSFSAGRVLMRSGAVSEQVLNYNVLTGEMIFGSNGKYMAIAQPQEVDTVFIQNRKFIPVGRHFYEWLSGHDPALFREYTCSVKEPGAETGFGKTNTTAATSLSTLVGTGGAYELKLPDEFKVIPGHNYWIRKEDKYYKINNAQQLGRVFPQKKELINDWMKKNNATFSKDEDVIRLIDSIR